MAILEQLPAKVEALAGQISQLRDEMHVEFSAVRNEITAGDERVITGLREEIRAGDERVITTLREEIRAGDERVVTTLREEIRAGDESVITTLRDEIRAGDEQVMTQARVLYEDLKESLVLIHESLPPRRRPGRRNR